MNKLISVVIPLYNAEKYIAETLDSVLCQIYLNWECIIIDDGSTDKSADIVLEYTRRDERFLYFRQENGGPSKARNYGLALSKGEYIQFLDADDVLLPDRFKVMLCMYQGAEHHIVLYSNLVLGSNDDICVNKVFSRLTTIGKDLDFNLIYKYFGAKLSFIPGAILFPKRCLEHEKWDENLKYSEDWDLYLRIAQQGFVFRNIDKVLFVYRDTENSLSKRIKNVIESNYQILLHYSTPRNYVYYIARVSETLFKNSLHIRHKRMNLFVKPYIINGKLSGKAFMLSLVAYAYFPIYAMTKKIQKSNHDKSTRHNCHI